MSLPAARTDAITCIAITPVWNVLYILRKVNIKSRDETT